MILWCIIALSFSSAHDINSSQRVPCDERQNLDAPTIVTNLNSNSSVKSHGSDEQVDHAHTNHVCYPFGNVRSCGTLFYHLILWFESKNYIWASRKQYENKLNTNKNDKTTFVVE